MTNETMRQTLRVTKALGDLQRLRILMLVQPDELCACQIVEVLGLAPSTVSKHLSLLSEAGLLAARKEGRWMHYRLPEGADGAKVRPLMKWLVSVLADEIAMQQDAAALRRVLVCAPEEICRRQRKRCE